MVEEGQHFLLAEHDGQFVGTADAREMLVGPGHLQGDEVEELHRGDILVDSFGRGFTLVEQIELVLADSLQVEQLR